MEKVLEMRMERAKRKAQIARAISTMLYIICIPVICVAGFITFMSAFISKYPDYSILIISLVIVFSTSYYIERYFVKKYHDVRRQWKRRTSGY